MVPKTQSYLDSEALKTFLTVVEEGSFTAAAAALYKTPSAVSYRIKALEDALGVQLLERTTHATTTTLAGTWLYERAQHILGMHQRFYDELEVMKTGVEPTFTLVFNNLLYDDEAAARLLMHLNKRFPETAFYVQMSVFTGVWDYMIYEGGSFAIGAPSFHSVDEGFLTHPLGLVEWVMVCAPSHPILKEARIDGSILKRYPVINIKDTSIHSDGRPAWRLEGQHEIIVPNLRTKVLCHSMGLGIGFLPKPMAAPLLDEGMLVELRAEDVSRQASPMSYVRRKGDDGRIGNYLEYLIKRDHELVQPFLLPLSRQGVQANV